MEQWESDAAGLLERIAEGPLRDAFRGTVRVIAASEPRGRRRYQACTLELELAAPGLAPEPLTTEVVVDRRYWPQPGTVLSALISRTRPRLLEVDWDALAR